MMRADNLFLFEKINKDNLMKRLIYFLILIFINTSFSQTVIWQDLMDGDNSISALQARGWVVLNEDGSSSSSTPAFYQGQPAVFSAYDGPDSGYVASNYAGANAQDFIDQWLISPLIQVSAGDYLLFYARSDSNSAYADSINLLVATDGGTSVSDFSLLARYDVYKTDWNWFRINFNTSGTRRFAIEYLMHNKSDASYIGLDDFKLYNSSTPAYLSTLTLNQTLTFSDPTKSSSYRMIGIPGQSSMSITQFLSGDNNTDWKVFYDNGAQTNYLVSYDGSNQFNLGQGRAFWVLSKNKINISTQVTSVTLVNGNLFNVALHSGWNIITNPFDKDVNWNLVQSLNAIPTNAAIYYWDGNSWSEPTTFSAYSGYYFNNIYNLTSISIPYNFTAKKLPLNKTLIHNKADGLKLTLVSNGIEKSSVTFGLNKNSSAGLDKYDLFAPPGHFDEVRIDINDDNLKTNYKKLFKDIIPSVGEGKTFHVSIKNMTKKEVLLKAKGIQEFSGYNIYLFNKNLNSYYDLNVDSSLILNSSPSQQNFDLIITKSDSIKTLVKNSLPAKFAIYQNYPNPFNPTTIIRYSIPVVKTGNSSSVQLKVYDVLGREVVTLVNKEQAPGKYEVQFDGSKLASGIYFYKLNAGRFSQTKKMLLLK